MKKFLVAFTNWHDGSIQFAEELASTGLEAMKSLDGLYRFDHIKDEEEYFKKVVSSGGFVAYEELNPL